MPRPAPAHRAAGFTLVELLVTLTVLGVTLAIGLPSFKSLMARNRVTGETNEFVGGLNLARSEAVRRTQPVALRSADASADFGTGWDAFTDANANGAKASPATATDGTVLRTYSPTGRRIWLERVTRGGTSPNFTYAVATASVADRMYVVFNSRGGTEAAGTTYYRVCDKGDTSVKGRVIQISVTGMVSIVDANVTCPSS